MTDAESKPERLTEYERAICYYTIPAMVHPVTFRLIAAYGFVALTTLFLAAYGIRTEHPTWETWGPVLFGVAALGGILGFVARAVIGQVRRESAIAEAETVPNVESGFDDLPDPFQGHMLMRCSMHRDANRIEITDNKCNPMFEVTVGDDKRWTIANHEGAPEVTVTAVHANESFTFGMGTPGNLEVARGDTKVASVHRKFSFGSSPVEIHYEDADKEPLVFREGGIFHGNKLIGRIYSIRNYVYLDLERGEFDEGTLALFVSMV